MLEAKARKEREVHHGREPGLLLDQSVGSSVRGSTSCCAGPTRVERAFAGQGRLERDDFDSVIDLHRDGLSQTVQGPGQ